MDRTGSAVVSDNEHFNVMLMGTASIDPHNPHYV